MSRIYFFAWNERQGIPPPASAHTRDKRTEGLPLRRLVLALALAFPAYALALPDGGQISAGSGDIGQSGSTLTVTQTSPKLAINWQSFNIGQSETVNFNQPGSSAIALNRVIGQNPSQILGSLSANGQVFVLNPNGVLFGSTAQVNVGGLVASTLGLSDGNFMVGNYTFSNSGTAGSVVNQGTLIAANGGYIALLAPEARNEGVIVATLGTALLAAGDKVTLNLNNGSLLSYSVDQGSFDALAENKQLIQADGGHVILTARAADALTRAVVNNSGIIEARTIQNRGGVIQLLGDMQSGQVNVGGTLDASAPNGGDGGFVETSAAHVKVASGAKITTAAAQGKTGSWLIDPPDFTIAAAGGDITGADLAFNLGSTDITIFSSQGTVNPSGNGDIFVNDAVSWNSVKSLTLNAVRNINVNSAITNSGTGAINLTAAAAVAVNANLSTAGAIAITAPAGLTQDVASTITTGTGLTVDVGAASAANGFIAGAGGLTKAGSGTLSLSGVNTYTGATAINAGILSLSGDGSGGDSNLGAAPGAPTPGHLILNGGTLQTTADVALNANRGIALTGAGVFDTDAGSQLYISGIIDGAGTLTKVGTGLLILAGSNTYTGATTINAGKVLIGYDSGLGAAPGTATPGHLTFNGGTLEIQNASSVVLNANRGITLMAGGGGIDTATGNTTTYAGIIAGSGALTKGLGGILELSGANSYTGLTTVSGGTLRLAGGAAIADTGAVNLSTSGAVLRLLANETIGSLTGITGTTANLQNSSTLTTGDASSTTFAGVISNTGGIGNISKQGAGTFTLSGANTYTGLTTVNAGTLAYGANNVLSTGAVTVNGGTLNIGSYSDTVGAVTLTGGAIAGTTGVLTGTSYGVQAGTISAILGGAAALTKTTAGTVTLSGTNTYTGATTINEGTLSAGTIANGGVASNLGASTNAAANLVLGGGTLQYTGANASTDRNFTLTAGTTSSIDVTANNLTISGASASTTGALTKTGSGTLTLSGANQHTGETAVNAGTLAYGANNVLATGAVTVNGGTLDIGSYSDTVGAVTLTGGNITGTTGVLTGTSYDVRNGMISAILGGTGTLAKTTGGTVTLSGANTYTGLTTISAGKLVAANADALGSTAGGTTVADAATLEIANVAIGNEAVALNGSGIGGTGALTGSGTASLAGPVTLATDSVLGAAGGNSLALNGAIEGAGALDVLGGGTVTLGGTIGSSTALASFNGAFGTALAINGGLVRTSGAQTYSGATTFGAATTLRTTAGGNVSAPGAVTATAGTLTLDSGAGNATLTNVNNNFGTVAATSGANISIVDANALSIGGINATGLVDIRTQSGDLTLNNAIATTSTSANAVTLIADAAATPDATGSGGNFKNAGAAAITTGAGGAWRIYTGNPTGTTRGGLTEAGKRYNIDDGSDPIASGNRIYFRIQPTLTLTADNKTKIYGDANPAFTYSYSALIDSDLIGAAISSGPSYAVDGSTSTSGQLTAGTLHNITPSAATASSLGYSLSYAGGALTVNKKTLTVAATGTNKVYDTNPTATVTYSDNRVASDLLTIGGTAAFLDKNVGTGKTVNVSGITLGNTDAGNYTFNATASTTADITAANLAVTGVTASNKVYDGNTDAILGGAAAITALGTDSVTLGGIGAGLFADKNVANGKAVTVNGYTISGTDAGNYSLLQPAGLTANIAARPLTISAAGVNKAYDGYTTATVTYADNRVSGDLLTIGGTAAYLDKNVGTGKTVNVSGINLSSADAGNYTYNTTAATIADITARALAITANDATQTYTGAAYSGGNGVTYSGFANSETAAVLGGTLAYGGTSQGAISAGSYLITPRGLTSGNYIITYIDGKLTITPVPAAASLLSLSPEASGILPAITDAVLALPGGKDLLPAFNAAMVAARAPVNPVVDSSGILDVFKLQPAGVSTRNNVTVEQMGNVTLVNRGVKLPPNTLSTAE